MATTAERSRELRRRVLRPRESLAEIEGRERPGDHYAGVEVGGALVAVGWTRPEGPPGSWRVGSMATSESHRGRGLGAAVLAELVAHARDNGATRIWCNARLGAIGFYERPGWAIESAEPYDVPGAGPHHLMARSLER